MRDKNGKFSTWYRIGESASLQAHMRACTFISANYEQLVSRYWRYPDAYGLNMRQYPALYPSKFLYTAGVLRR